MKIAAVQYRPPHGRPARARKDLARRVRAAVEAGARLVVLPEMATTGYVWPDADALRPHAEPAHGPTLDALRQAAQAGGGAWVVCGFAERADDGTLFNSALVLRPDGELGACYRKVLLYDLDRTWAQPGRQRVILPTTFGSVAPAICMDLNDDRFTTWLHMTTPDILAFCTNWVEEGEDVHAWWRLRLRGWRGWLVAANRWGEEAGTRFSGRSAILAPGGALAATADAEGDAILLVETEDFVRPLDETDPDLARWS